MGLSPKIYMGSSHNLRGLPLNFNWMQSTWGQVLDIHRGLGMECLSPHVPLVSTGGILETFSWHYKQ